MKLLLDTHTALWLFNDYEKLSTVARDLLMDETNTLHISIASAWEVAIKYSLGKLTEFPEGVKLFFEEINNCPIEMLTVIPAYIERVERLPYVHRDPFDRIIIATALCEGMAIVTTDENIHKYGVKCVW